MENKILIQEFKNLKNEINPRQAWVSLSRDLLLKQINSQGQLPEAKIGVSGYFKLFTRVFQQHLLEPAVVMLLILGTFLGSSLAINAAFYSLPGEPLYKVKLALENTHSALTTGDERKAELQVEFAQKRVVEFDKIVAQPNVDPQIKKKRIQEVVKEFQNNVVAVNDHLNKLNESLDPQDSKEQKVQMAISVSSKATDLIKSFSEKAEGLGLTEVEKQEVQDIIDQAVTSAQDLADDANLIITKDNQRLDDEAEAQKIEEGTVKGVSNEDTDNEEIVEDAEIIENNIVDGENLPNDGDIEDPEDIK